MKLKKTNGIGIEQGSDRVNQEFRRINLSWGCKMASGRKGGLMARTLGIKVLQFRLKVQGATAFTEVYVILISSD